ncbi:MAG: flavin reductase [Candidatus Wallbacteria bacterium]|nr:flavin reductase [Candidatus Wallbacteria bacterium]
MNTQAIKAALRTFPYGVYLLGTEHAGETRVATVTWVTQASFSPPLVVMGVKKTGRTFGLLKHSRKFSLSVLETGQKEIAFAFFKTAEVVGGAASGFAFETARAGVPLLSRALAWLEGRVLHIDETGDHAVVIGQVTAAAQKREGLPLTLAELGLKYGG